MKTIRAFLIILLIAAAIYAAYLYAPRKPAAEAAQPAPQETLARYDVNGKTDVYAAGGGAGLFVVSKDGARFLTPTGKDTMNHAFSAAAPTMAGAGGVCAVVEKAGGAAYVFGQTKMMYELQAEYPIVHFAVNAKGYLSLVMRDGKDYRANVYGPGGEVRSRGLFPGNRAALVSSAVSEDGRLLAVCFLDTSGTQAASRIDFYHINKSESSDQTDRPFVSSETYEGRIVGAMRFFDDALVAVSNDALLRLKPEAEGGVAETAVPLGSKLTALSMDDGHIALAFGERLPGGQTEPERLVRLYDASLKPLGDYEAAAPVGYLSCGHGGVVVGAGRTFTILSQSAAPLWTTEATADIRKAVLISNNEIALCGATEIVAGKWK